MVSKTQAEAPIRSLDQRMEALKRANDIRVRRARLKKDLKDGHVQIEQILSNPPEYVSTAKVFDMLMAVPKFGRVKAARFLNQATFGATRIRVRSMLGPYAAPPAGSSRNGGDGANRVCGCAGEYPAPATSLSSRVGPAACRSFRP